MATWRERLANGPRICGEVDLITFDLAIRRLVVSYYAEFEGVLPIPALEEGLLAAVRAYPVVLGHFVKNQSDGSYKLRWDSSDTKQKTFGWYHRVVGKNSSGSSSSSSGHFPQGPAQQQQQQRVPSIFSTYHLWWDGALPDMRGRLAGAKVSVYPTANKSIIVFSFSHALFDWPTGYEFMHTWLDAAIAAAAAPSKALPVAAAAAVPYKALSPPPAAAAAAPDLSRSSSQESSSSATVDALVILAPCEMLSDPKDLICNKDDKKVTALDGSNKGLIMLQATFAAQEGDSSSSSSSVLGEDPAPDKDMIAALPAPPAAAAAAAVTDTGLTKFSRECYRRPAAASPDWQVPETRLGCLQWLKDHCMAPDGPFAWDPLSRPSSCMMSWRLLFRCLRTERSVWSIPHHLLSTWKAAANSSCPLPEGLWYSAAAAATALMAVTMFAADPAKALEHGGVYVTQVVNIRGGRCGMAVPKNTATNASVVGVSIWVPLTLLQAAAEHLPITTAPSSSSSSGSTCSLCARHQPNVAAAAAAAAVPGPCPMLIRHIRLDLQRQLQDPDSYIAKQFEWYEVCGSAGLGDNFLVGHPQREMAMGEVTVNNLTAAHDLPECTGTKLLNCSVCVLQDYGDRHVMTTPVPAAGSSNSAAKAYDLQLEICFPRRRCPKLYQCWKQLGLQHVATPSRGYFATAAAAAASTTTSSDLSLSSSSSSSSSAYMQWYFQPFDFFAHPVILINFYVLGLAHLPWLLMEWIRVACRWCLKVLGF